MNYITSSKMSNQLFNTADERFSIEAFGVQINCQRLDLPKQIAYHVTFSSDRKPIVVARARFVDSPATWTSIPEGRQKEAEGLGQLIEDFLSTKQ